MRAWLIVTCTVLAAAPVLAADLELTIDIPQMNVAEYHRPYVAVWVERPDRTIAANLAVWYAMTGRQERDGSRWLQDLRQWWRRGGREVRMPVDVVSGATRPPGRHRLTFSGSKGPLATLPPGTYRLVVEAAREVGGRELVELPFTWPPSAGETLRREGRSELGAITLTVRP